MAAIFRGDLTGTSGVGVGMCMVGVTESVRLASGYMMVLLPMLYMYRVLSHNLYNICFMGAPIVVQFGNVSMKKSYLVETKKNPHTYFYVWGRV